MSVSVQVFGQAIRGTEMCAPCSPGWSCYYRRHKQRKPRRFAISEDLAIWSSPTLFESKLIETKTKVKEVMTVEGYKPFYNYLYSRVWVNEAGETIRDSDLKKYDWRWTGKFNTYIGKNYKTKKKVA